MTYITTIERFRSLLRIATCGDSYSINVAIWSCLLIIETWCAFVWTIVYDTIKMNRRRQNMIICHIWYKKTNEIDCKTVIFSLSLVVFPLKSLRHFQYSFLFHLVFINIFGDRLNYLHRQDNRAKFINFPSFSVCLFKSVKQSRLLTFDFETFACLMLK